MIGSFLVLSILTGIITGFFVVLYGLITKGLTYLLFWGDPIETISNLPTWYIYLVTIVSIYIVNILVSKYSSIKEYGIQEIAEAISENKLVFNLKELIIKIFASSLSLASGFAIGNEGPSAAIGAMIATKIHKFLNLPKDLLKIAISIGASSGIATIFVSPITGITFAMENIAYKFMQNFASYLILASVIAFSIGAYFLEPLVFNYNTGKALNYHYILATLAFIPIITFFVYFYLGLKDKVLFFLTNKFQFLHKYSSLGLSVLAGSIISTIMIINPYAVFSGHELVKILINDNINLPFWIIFIVIVLRIIATTVSLYANAIGGVFVSLMSIGALIGYGFGEMFNHFFSYHLEPFYFAAIGAAIFMGVIMRLPFTAVILALETTYDYNIIVPTGIGVVLVTYLASLQFDVKKFNLRRK